MISLFLEISWFPIFKGHCESRGPEHYTPFHTSRAASLASLPRLYVKKKHKTKWRQLCVISSKIKAFKSLHWNFATTIMNTEMDSSSWLAIRVQIYSDCSSCLWREAASGTGRRSIFGGKLNWVLLINPVKRHGEGGRLGVRSRDTVGNVVGSILSVDPLEIDSRLVY